MVILTPIGGLTAMGSPIGKIGMLHGYNADTGSFQFVPDKADIGTIGGGVCKMEDRYALQAWEL